MAFASLRAFRSMADFDFATERCAAQASFAGPGAGEWSDRDGALWMSR